MSRQATIGPIRHIKAHARLLIAIGVGVATGVILYRSADLVTRILIGWNIGAFVFVALTWRMMATTGETQLQRKAAEEDEPRTVILVVMVAAVLASLGGTVYEVQAARAATGASFVMATALCIATVVFSWLCMHTLFAIHYAHDFYGERSGKSTSERGLAFAQSSSGVGYMEFIYMAFCIGMTYQLSDIMARNRKFRRLITVHAGLSFFYNTFILALAVNFISGLGHNV